jgi:HSP20 family protein
MPPLPARRRSNDIQRWDPLRDLVDIRDQMDRLFDETLGRTFGDQVWSPPVDIEEQEDAWLVEADLPGVKRDDVSVELHDGELAIHGEPKEKERTGILRRRTRRTGRFDYRVSLPGDLDPDRVEADLSDGVLHVRLPKPERSKPRRIEVRG